MRVYGLVVGVNNFRTGRGHTATTIAAVANQALKDTGHGRLVDQSGSTGNYILDINDDSPLDAVARLLTEATGRPWALIDAEHLNDMLESLTELDEPPAEDDVRWTDGLAIAATPPPPPATDWVSTPHGRLRRLAPAVYALTKRDQLISGTDTLDHSLRGGGWGQLSQDITRTAGGIWTSRSIHTLETLRTKRHGTPRDWQDATATSHATPS